MARRVPVTAAADEAGSPSPAVVACSAPARNPVVISPPPDVRCIVDKTAEFVAQNGIEFEQKILSNEKRNPRFNFLKAKDAYHSYYQHRILEFIDQSKPESPPLKPADRGAATDGSE